MFDIVEISFEETLPLWQTAWNDPHSKIEPQSVITYGHFPFVRDLSHYNEPARFFGIHEAGTLVAFGAGHRTHATYRVRTHVVAPGYKGLGMGRALVERTYEIARSYGCTLAWGLPRRSTLKFWESTGLCQTSDFFNDSAAANCFALKQL